VRLQRWHWLPQRVTSLGPACRQYTFSVEIVPICKDDVVCFSPGLVKHFGGISPIFICDRVGTSLHLLDPTTLQSVRGMLLRGKREHASERAG
jgi:NMD protein affecting ribosome stability and mRNA decay